MSAVVLGEKARENHGLREKYIPGLRSEYKAYIDSLEQDMMTCVYSLTFNECIVNKTFDLLLTEQQINDCEGAEKYTELENAIMHFCMIHKCKVNFNRTNTELNVIVDMKLPYSLN